MEKIYNSVKTSIDSLDDYFLMNLFSYLNLKEKLSIERVCKRWQTIIRELVSKQTGVGTTWSEDSDWYCLQSNRDHCCVGGDIRSAIVMTNGWFYDLTNDKSLNNLEYISMKCPKIRSLYISHCIIDENCFKQLIHFFPSLECLYLKSNILKEVVIDNEYKNSAKEWDHIGKLLGQRIRHLGLDPHYEHRMNESEIKHLLQHFKCLKELRIGTHFDREVVGKFVNHLKENVKLFYSIGRELSLEALTTLENKQKKSLTHLTFFSNSSSSVTALERIGQTFSNLIRLKVNLSFNELILSSTSPISHLQKLQEFSVDLNAFSDNHVDDGLIWCIKDGLPSIRVLEISRASLSSRSFNSIHYCLPQLTKLVLKSVEFQCCCDSGEIRDRTERYCCSICRSKCWSSLSNMKNLKNLVISSTYNRNDKMKVFHNELSLLLPNFKCLRFLSIFRYDISQTELFDYLNELMLESDPEDIFTLRLKSIPFDLNNKNISKNICVIQENFML